MERAGEKRRPTCASISNPPESPVQINFSRLPVEANAGGLIFVVGAVSAILIGLSEARWFFAVTFLLGAIVATGLVFWRRR